MMLKKIFIYSLSLLSLLTPLAAVFSTTTNDTLPGQPKTISFQLTNPLNLPDDATLLDLVAKLIDGAMLIAIPVIVILIIYTGFKFVIARGNEKEIGEAKQMFFYVIIGTAIILGAKLIVSLIQNTISALIS